MTAQGEASPLASAERVLFDGLGVTVSEHVVDLERLRCSVRVHECGSGPPVVFVHGAMTAAASWAPLAAALGDLRCLLVDRPGCGLSTLPAGDQRSLAAQQRIAADLVADVLDALDVAVADVVCTSMGGWYALQGAARHPERVRRIVAVGYQVGAPIQRAPLTMRLRPPAWLAGRLRISRGVLRRMLASAGMRGAIESGAFTDEMLDWMVVLMNETDTMRNELLHPPRPVGLRGPVESVELGPELAQRITAPVHLVWGTDDPFGDEATARTLARLLPTASVQMVPGAGHAPWIDQPEIVAAAVRSHLLV